MVGRIHTLPLQDALLTVTLDDRPVGAMDENGDMYQQRRDLDTTETKDLYVMVLDKPCNGETLAENELDGDGNKVFFAPVKMIATNGNTPD